MLRWLIPAQTNARKQRTRTKTASAHCPIHRPSSRGSQGQAEQLLAQHVQQGSEENKGLLRNTACVPRAELHGSARLALAEIHPWPGAQEFAAIRTQGSHWSEWKSFPLQAQLCADFSRAAAPERPEHQLNRTETMDSTNKFSNTQDNEYSIRLSTSETFRSKPRILAKQPDKASNT